MTLPVDDTLAAAYARDGVACVRSVLDAGQVAVASRAIDAVLASPSPLSQVASGADDPGASTPLPPSSRTPSRRPATGTTGTSLDALPNLSRIRREGRAGAVIVD